MPPTESEDGRRARSKKRRGQIIHAGVMLATVDGLDRFSLDRLASESGVTKSGIQILYKDKAGLQRAIVEAARREIRTKVLLPAAEAEPGLPRVVRFGQQWVAHMVDTDAVGGCFFCATWSELQARPGPLRDLVIEDRRAWLDGLSGAVALARGGKRPNRHSAELALGLLGLGQAINTELQVADAPMSLTKAQRLWVDAAGRLEISDR